MGTTSRADASANLTAPQLLARGRAELSFYRQHQSTRSKPKYDYHGNLASADAGPGSSSPARSVGRP